MSAEHLKLLEYALFGGIAALLGSMAKSRRLTLPRLVVERQADGEVVKMIDLGFLATPVLGAVLAAIIDGRPQTAIAYGLAAGYAGPSIISAIIDPLLRKLGYNPDAPSAQLPPAGSLTTPAALE